jgi:hypothetical protein
MIQVDAPEQGVCIAGVRLFAKTTTEDNQAKENSGTRS